MRAHVNAEFKARCSDLNDAVRRLRAVEARGAGRERQVDTYYRVGKGRLKVRETGGRAALVWYFREDALRSKRSDVLLLPLSEVREAKRMLGRTLGVKVVVDKVRAVYLKDNARVHLDNVRGLGRFLEGEAVGQAKEFRHLRGQAGEMVRVLGLASSDLVPASYSDRVERSRRR